MYMLVCFLILYFVFFQMNGLLAFLFVLWSPIARTFSRSIPLEAGTFPDLQCLVLHPKSMTCHWRPLVDHPLNTSHRLMYQLKREMQVNECKDYVTGGPNSCYFSRENLCLYWTYEIWIETFNHFGSQESQKLIFNTEDVSKTEPPLNLTLTDCITHLQVEWEYPDGIHSSYFPLMFELRYLEHGTGEWLLESDVGEQTSYSIYDVAPEQTYTVQVRCKNANHRGFWSDWSPPVTLSTAMRRK
ncbi:prolactin receptor-like [Pleurodeles waltl]|uniref:prolactin receptor-like n=1 Tax=Pleurodeles waltl TaxID=8319 RepID=UPI003709BE62